MTRHRKIVVGVDGSICSRNVLAWAASEAVLRDCDLEVVYAWSIGAIAWASPGTAMMLKNTDLQQVGIDLLADAVDELGEMPANVMTEVIQDEPAEALLSRADDAEMLVLGAHGKDGLATLRFRPTHQQCLRHAKCPVVIIPEEPR